MFLPDLKFLLCLRRFILAVEIVSRMAPRLNVERQNVESINVKKCRINQVSVRQLAMMSIF
jgi:hypothetical protein